MQTTLTVLTRGWIEAFVAQVAGTEQPDSRKGRTQLIHEALGDGGQNFVEFQTGCHLEGDMFEINMGFVRFHDFLGHRRVKV
jgi:hypothetical protein